VEKESSWIANAIITIAKEKKNRDYPGLRRVLDNPSQIHSNCYIKSDTLNMIVTHYPLLNFSLCCRSLTPPVQICLTMLPTAV
jgi:hypothetical protein